MAAKCIPEVTYLASCKLAPTSSASSAERVARLLERLPELLRQPAIPDWITIRGLGWPISKEEVWASIAAFVGKQGWKESELPAAQALQWSDGVTARNQNPDLQVMAVIWDSAQRGLNARLRCADRSLCGSYLVRLPPRQPTSSNGQERAIGLELGRSYPGIEKSPIPESGVAARGPVLAERGTAAELVVDGDGFRVSLPVICLERGALGQEIRARERSGYRVFVAEVIGAGRLRTVF